MLKNVKKNQKGFTLVELIVVIAILGILATLLVPKIMGNVDDAKRSREISNARTLASEITTNNAVAKVEDDDSKLIPSNLKSLADSDFPYKLDNSMLGHLAFDDEKDFPDENYVEIYVDKDGNATIKEVNN